MELNAQNFQQYIHSEELVGVAFLFDYTPEILEATAQLKLPRVNIVEEPEVALEYGIRFTPTFVLFRRGRPVGFKVGFKDVKDLASWFQDKIDNLVTLH